MDCSPTALAEAAKCFSCIPRGMTQPVKTMLMAKWAGCVEPTEFSPSDIAGLALWMEANKGVHLSGSTVLQWDDQSGNGIIFGQSPDTFAPTFNPSGLNGKSALSFQLLSPASLITTSVGPALPLSLFAVIQSTTNSTDEQNIIGCNGLLSGAYCDVNLSRQLDWFNGTANTTTANPAYSDGVAFLYEMVNDGVSNPDMLVNGSSQACAPISINHFGLNAGPMSIGMGDTSLGIKALNGYISEIVVYDSALSASNRQQVEGYLMTKWAI